MGSYAIGPYCDQPMIRHADPNLRSRTLADLSRSFYVGDTSPSPNTPLSYQMRTWSWRTFRQSRLDDVHYSDPWFYHGTFRPYPVIDRYDRRDHSTLPYTYWSKGYCSELYPSDRPELYRRTHEPYRDEYSYRLWSAPRRALLRDVFERVPA